MSIASALVKEIIFVSISLYHIPTTQTFRRSFPHSTSRWISRSFSARPAMTIPSSKIRAPWRDVFDSHFNKTPDYDFTIATVGYDTSGCPVPRVRTCGFRGFFPELELHPNGRKDMAQQVEDAGNPPIYESDMLTFTTDIRMEKLGQIQSSGNAIEAMFWLKDLKVQWRIKGKAYPIGDPNGKENTGECISQEAIKPGLRLKTRDDLAKWTWEKAVTKYFANHSPTMRGSFRNPSPGKPRSQTPDNPDLQFGQRVTDLHDPIARANFRVVVIVPEEVEHLDVSDLDDARRRSWKLVKHSHLESQSDSLWVETELWP
ncbi:hypothetical protein N7462_004817 [Penicillium macrosclerotiorum]|uniref:uncharacterized protein n=1 Tax=Penicillium macrosclerotiorum TaxID=303699 RepID=UPI0025499A53|nr:uncharacterized protein N7462_004817 [Penicillium macrosclerotiorum]KAJ5690425.1 hypothetical protein N7462_004817 [Penicillium macrosclerotiorum]